MKEKISNLKKIRLGKINKILIIRQELFNSNDEIMDKAARELQKGVKLVELYPDFNSDRNLLKLCQRLRQLTSIYNCLFLIKDRLDISKLVDSDGAVLDFKSIEINFAHKLLKEDKFFAYELHNETEFENANFKFDFFQLDFASKKDFNTDVIIFKNDCIERLK